jgi:endonuclease/exonuclease/phosphatase family metal-dependent hydrolase
MAVDARRLRRWSLFLLVLGFQTVLVRGAAAQADEEADEVRSGALQMLRVMTANVRYGTANDGPDHWDRRKDLLVDVLKDENPDLIGTQEMLPFQADYLEQHLQGYTYVGRSRELDNTDGEQCGVFFRSDRFVELERGHLWLSEEPERPGSQAWDAALPRMATWLKLYDRAGRRVFVVINTHFDHSGVEARRQSAVLLREYARRFASQYPLIVTGDFNCGEGSDPYQELVGGMAEDASPLLDAYRQANPTRTDAEGTFNGFAGRRDGPRIDWILATPAWRTVAAHIVTTQRDGRYPSDHFPVVAELSY